MNVVFSKVVLLKQRFELPAGRHNGIGRVSIGSQVAAPWFYTGFTSHAPILRAGLHATRGFADIGVTAGILKPSFEIGNRESREVTNSPGFVNCGALAQMSIAIC